MRVKDLLPKLGKTWMTGDRKHVIDGDRLRDAGKYAEAAKAYAEYLAGHPDEFGIWVQRGNCLKDSGQHAAALAAYEAALALRPDDADVYLQMGHLFKLNGDRDLALKAYKRSMHLNPNVATAAELMAVGGAEKDISQYLQPLGKVCYFEVGDLLDYLKVHNNPSGIQRVQAGLVEALALRTESENAVRFVLREVNSSSLSIRLLDERRIVEFIKYASSREAQRHKLSQMISELEAGTVGVTPKAGDSYVILGAFWAFGGHLSQLIDLKRDGVFIGAYIYDIIPITHPEYCDNGLVSAFTRSLGDGLGIFDFILTISEYTARELKRLCQVHGLREIPISAVPLAHELTTPTFDEPDQVRDEVRRFAHTSFVLFVSTIEIRKNHALVILAWREMMREGLSPPDLVFVGRRGWRVDNLFQSIESTDYLDGRLHVLHDLSDTDLKKLYEMSLFTIFPSFVEGWGLPVGESLVAGRPCVASNTSSIPEVGGDFVDYIDPLDTRGAIATIRKMCFDEEYRVRRTKLIERDFDARTWKDVARDFLDRIEHFKPQLTSSKIGVHLPILAEGEIFAPRDLFNRKFDEKYLATPFCLLLDGTWYSAEDSGAWMRGNEGRLTIRTPLSLGDEVIVIIEVVSAPWARGCDVAVRSVAGYQDASRFLDRKSWHKVDERGFLKLRAKVGGQGHLYLTVNVKQECHPQAGDSRLFNIGLVSLRYVGVHNVGMRLEMLEQLVYGFRE